MIQKNYFSDLIKLALTILFFSVSWSFTSSNTTVPVNVGVIFDDLTSGSAKTWLSCFKTAVSDFYASNHYYKTRLVLHIRDSKGSFVGSAAAGSRLKLALLNMYFNHTYPS